MQLLHVKQNIDLLEGTEQLELLGVPACSLRDPQVFASIFEEIEAEEDADMLTRLSAPLATVDAAPAAVLDNAPELDGVAPDISDWY